MLTTLPNAFYMTFHDLAAPITTTSMSLFTVPPSSLHSEDQDYCKLWMHEVFMILQCDYVSNFTLLPCH